MSAYWDLLLNKYLAFALVVLTEHQKINFFFQITLS